MSFIESALALSWIAIALLALGMAGLLRQLRELSERVQNPGMMPERFEQRVVEELARLNLRVSEHSVVLFADAECVSCKEVIPQFEKMAAAVPEWNFVLMFAADASGSTDRSPVHVVRDASAAFARLRIPLTPFVVLTDEVGEIVQASPVGSTELLDDFMAVAKERFADETAA